MVVPTRDAGTVLDECLASLAAQTFRDLCVVIVDNSGRGAARTAALGRVLENASNAGFGAAMNQGMRVNRSEFIATLNDDALAEPRWLEALIAVADANPEAGMLASQVRLHGEDRLDSAGMRIAADGASKQRGHGQSPDNFSRTSHVLCPSGSAALYRREMLEDIGGFDDRFFLYCEDTDVGLRARWRAWESIYVPDAIVHHRYSHSAGRVSPLKVYLVERNRLYLLVKNFPAAALLRALAAAPVRYGWSALAAQRGKGAAGEFAGGIGNLAWLTAKAHLAAAAALPWLLRERRRIRQTAKLTPRQFVRTLRTHSISLREVASL